MLAGTASFEDAVVRDPDSGVDLLAAGDGHGNPITLLTSMRLMAVLREARERYDCVIIDTPPVLGLPDVAALSPAADAILFVVRWDRTTRDAAAAALKQLADVSAKVAGVVLNQVEHEEARLVRLRRCGTVLPQVQRVLRQMTRHPPALAGAGERRIDPKG